uniref:Uncharacterized protein n=1 Tax=Arundo donax TaxID=35708 RepID=A0A0A9EB91_ARUDO
MGQRASTGISTVNATHLTEPSHAMRGRCCRR